MEDRRISRHAERGRRNNFGFHVLINCLNKTLFEKIESPHQRAKRGDSRLVTHFLDLRNFERAEEREEVETIDAEKADSAVERGAVARTHLALSSL